jgi:hypothetical protein
LEFSCLFHNLCPGLYTLIFFSTVADMAQTCYLCGGPDETADHIPPKCFFPKPRPANLITVRCCNSCNNKWSLEDEAMRAVLSIPAGRSGAGDKIWEEGVVNRTIARSEPFRQYMLKRSREVAIRTPVGLQFAMTFKPPMERVEPFLVRLTKGLLRHHYPTYDYSQSVFTARNIPATPQAEKDLEPVLATLNAGMILDGVFYYFIGISDTQQSGVCVFVFYDVLAFFVHHSRAASEAFHA